MQLYVFAFKAHIGLLSAQKTGCWWEALTIAKTQQLALEKGRSVKRSTNYDKQDMEW